MAQTVTQDSLLKLLSDYGDRIRSLERALTTATVATEDWRIIGAAGQPAFQKSWTNYGSGYTTARFYKDTRGIVRLSGLITRTAGFIAGNATYFPIFTLPVGYRPLTPKVFTGWGWDQSNSVMRLDVNAAGELWISAATVNPGSVNAYVSLDGVSFRAEQ